MEEKIPVIAVVGPTATGKTNLAIQLAKRLNGEIISADSMQIYREVSICSARPTLEEMEGVPHHLMGFLSVEKVFSVAEYVARARACIQSIHARHKTIILCGGTGLYIDSLLKGITFNQHAESTTLIRTKLEQIAQEKGGSYLLQQLQTFDPETAERLHPNDLKRIIRAIEIYRITGKTMTEIRRKSRQLPSPYHTCFIGLDYRTIEARVQAIEHRVDSMVEHGLIAELTSLLSYACSTTAQGLIGYKEYKQYDDGECSLKEAINKIKVHTRQYAKRQKTWFKKNPSIHWLFRDSDCYPSLTEQKALAKIKSWEHDHHVFPSLL